jgi:two-component system chemotaxis response regulator CheY
MSTVLVVEDDDDLRDVVVQTLERNGFAVAGARDGQEALELLAKGPLPNLILLDLMMPRMSGYELLDHLANESMMTRPRVLVLTAGLEPRTFPTELVIGTVHKPFDIELLLDIVSGFLSAGVEQPPSPADPVELTTPN